VVLILDEFQEVVEIDAGLPRLMRSVFQQQPKVAHFYLGSKRGITGSSGLAMLGDGVDIKE
jgi:hypothetical protein